ncbi:MAG: DUF4363 family protein [Campylobacterales bacterium]|nr:DUF4363 family protein [Campylobacterales bacterium]
MRALSNSYNNLNTTTITNPYQQDKEQLNSYIDQIKKSIEKGDFDNAKSLLEESNKLMESNNSKRRSSTISQQQDKLKTQLDTLSDSINKKDKGSALGIISSIKDELKTNKNLILKSHNTSETVSELRSKYLLSVYA